MYVWRQWGSIWFKHCLMGWWWWPIKQKVNSVLLKSTHHFRNLIFPLFGSIISATNNTLASKNGWLIISDLVFALWWQDGVIWSIKTGNCEHRQVSWVGIKVFGHFRTILKGIGGVCRSCQPFSSTAATDSGFRWCHQCKMAAFDSTDQAPFYVKWQHILQLSPNQLAHCCSF